MKTSDFDYNLRDESIAQKPVSPRDSSKLIVINRETSSFEEKRFADICDYLNENDVLVINETKVIKARLKWYVELIDWRKKEIEVVLLKQLDMNRWECAVFPWERLKVWKIAYFESTDKTIGLIWKVKEITYSWRIMEFNSSWLEFFETVDKIWSIPLPPYINKWEQTLEEYNTVFAKYEWSAAAPTAWLHFTSDLLEKISLKWVKIEKVLLHIWLWTFKPITIDNILDHKMHEEYIEISKQTAQKLNEYKKSWKRIIAVWTTVVRTLESFADENWMIGYWEKKTDIFIYPWYKFRFVDRIITNFHLPKSTLLMLVSAFYDREKLLEIYEYAQNNKYRFFSFGDAMYII